MAVVTTLDAAPARFPGSRAGVLYTSFLRPADTTDYAVKDVVSDDTGDAKVLVFPGAGQSGFVESLTMTMAETSTATFFVMLFDSEPTNFLDNELLALVASDMPKIVGRYELLDAEKINIGSGLNLYFATDVGGAPERLPRKSYATPDGKLYGLLQSRTVYTPGSATKHSIRICISSF